MAATLGISPAQSPVIASTWESAGNAAGRSMPKAGNSKTLLLAEAVMGFHFSFAAGNRREALARLHRAVLLVRGVLDHIGGYHNYVADNGLDDGRWRPEIIGIGQALKVRSGESAASWLKRAQALLNADLAGPLTIGQRLSANQALGPMLAEISPTAIPAKTSHAIKGLEFPAVCVVLTTQKTGAILSVLDGSNSDSKAVEEARKIYVAASRAQRLLVIAVPKSRAAELKTRLSAGDHVPDLISL
jgi:superfamily I DNA/RNA helicase